jgi:hypothetical protein
MKCKKQAKNIYMETSYYSTGNEDTAGHFERHLPSNMLHVGIAQYAAYFIDISYKTKNGESKPLFSPTNFQIYIVGP